MSDRRIARALAGLAWASTALFLLHATAGHAQTNTTILATQDVAPYSFLPSLPRHNNPTMYAFRSVSTTGGTHDFESFLWFDVSASDIPPGEVLTQAQLLVTWSFGSDAFGDGPPSTAPAELNCHEITEDWEDATTTWLNRPAFESVPEDSITGLTGFGPILCDVTLLVFDWVHGTRPNYGIALTNDTDRVVGMYTLEADPSIPDGLKANLILTTEVPEPAIATGLTMGALSLSMWRRRRVPTTRVRA